MDGTKMIEGVIITPLKQIFHPKGNVFHGLKKSESSFIDFGEVYFSTIIFNDIKSWKKHLRMTLNLIVPVGEVKIVIYDNRPGSSTRGEFFDISLSLENYSRITIPPELWVAFKGIGRNKNLLLNIADMEHTPDEMERLELDMIQYKW
jgi:dTDP-4-dehydrorhamnose 3,5-epimerase